MGWRRAREGWRLAHVGGGGSATSIADGATLEGELIVPSGSDLVIQSGGHLSLPSLGRNAGTIDEPTIRATNDTNAGLCYDDDINEIVSVLASVPLSARALEVLAEQAITAAGNTISFGSQKPVAVKQLTNQTGAPITLTSNPPVALGAYNGQILILRNSGAGTDDIVLPHNSGLQLSGGINRTLGPGDRISLYYRSENTRWEQLTAVLAA